MDETTTRASAHDEDSLRRQLLCGLAQDVAHEALRAAGYPHPETCGVDLLVDALVLESLGHYR